MIEFNVQRRRLLIASGSTAMLSLIPFKAFAVSPTAVCTKVGQKIIFKGKNYVCAKSKGKLIWEAIVPVKPKILIHPTPSLPKSSPAAGPSAKPSESSKPTPAPTASKVSGFLVGHLSGLVEGESKVVMVKDLRGRTVGVTLFLAQGVVSAHSATCTHQGCQVAEFGKKLACPCHGSVFDGETGAVLNGPAGTPLQMYKIAQVGDDIYVASES